MEATMRRRALISGATTLAVAISLPGISPTQGAALLLQDDSGRIIGAADTGTGV